MQEYQYWRFSWTKYIFTFFTFLLPTTLFLEGEKERGSEYLLSTTLILIVFIRKQARDISWSRNSLLLSGNQTGEKRDTVFAKLCLWNCLGIVSFCCHISVVTYYKVPKRNWPVRVHRTLPVLASLERSPHPMQCKPLLLSSACTCPSIHSSGAPSGSNSGTVQAQSYCFYSHSERALLKSEEQ